MIENPYLSSSADRRQPPERKRFRISLLKTLLVIAFLGILVGLFLPARRGIREPARRTECANNLLKIGIALDLYRDVHGRFPPAFTVDDQGNPLHSWRTLILPFLDESHRYESIDLSKPWDHPSNLQALNIETPNVYRCPSTVLPDGHTNYVSLLGPSSVNREKQPVTIDEVLDNQGKTLLVIELPQNHSVHWMSPKDFDVKTFVSVTSLAKPAHPRGYNALFCDIRTRLLPKERISEEILGAMISCDGKDDGLITDDW